MDTRRAVAGRDVVFPRCRPQRWRRWRLGAEGLLTRSGRVALCELAPTARADQQIHARSREGVTCGRPRERGPDRPTDGQARHLGWRTRARFRPTQAPLDPLGDQRTTSSHRAGAVAAVHKCTTRHPAVMARRQHGRERASTLARGIGAPGRHRRRRTFAGLMDNSCTENRPAVIRVEAGQKDVSSPPRRPRGGRCHRWPISLERDRRRQPGWATRPSSYMLLGTSAPHDGCRPEAARGDRQDTRPDPGRIGLCWRHRLTDSPDRRGR